MDISRLLRQSAALPLRAAMAGVNTTVAVATMPVRGAASLVSNTESPTQILGEFIGGKRTRRCWRGRGSAWIEVRGLNDAQRGRELGTAILESVRAHPGVASAVL